MAEATTARTPTGPEPAVSWLDEAVADAMTVLERIHADARTALDAISPETASVIRGEVDSGKF
ncbi:MAG TPA: hypothetical protein VJ914_32240 [Pseudonocardiaceae bacterium]|nr:hypothetical protein [Pseudonocardiaceae bacterium]